MPRHLLLMAMLWTYAFAGCIQQDAALVSDSDIAAKHDQSSEDASNNDTETNRDQAPFQRETELQIDTERREAASRLETTSRTAALVSCPANGLVAFSTTGRSHTSSNNDDKLQYDTNYTNLGSGWNGRDTFTAPCNGLYVFTVSFVKDAYYLDGTTDDVFVTIRRNGSSVGFAWSGEGAGMRGTGTYTVALHLNAGDEVDTQAGSDAGFKRHIVMFNFTGFLVKQ